MTRWLWCSGTKLFLKFGEVKWYTALVLCTAYEIGTTYESFSQNLAHIEYFARNAVVACETSRAG